MLQTLRPGIRSMLARSVQRKTYATAGGDALGEAFVKEREAIKSHAASSSELWRKITYYVAFPSIVLALVNAYNLAKEHEHHLEHIKEENGGELPERIHYDYLNIRNKSFPWGNYIVLFRSTSSIPLISSFNSNKFLFKVR
ncbi:Cytochrome c oxidase subunit 6A, mitochondrial [Puccinia graminis f. sp. tritici]|uniref:Cytochrome c oxidase subunit 6A, mitochondrial n=1 Tax=Puccinia graminis f. sp. tritici TaxID=56615 RepID=A0A5B0RPP3_PUCGR|nr:Cytochrome c oxidase subunit 6A, mitochondrial [Puccinia graminis f. sp. tritici]